jgi:tRNA (guanine10-N2)-dimethyltransferase
MYGLSMPLHKQNANALSLKKAIKNTGRSVRVVPNTEAALTSAQTYHNSMTSAVGLELVFVSDGTNTHVGRVTDVQNIDSYTARDRSRPKRDAFVGMLPPKLAQTIINIATGSATSGVVLDPFCGTGVILQEAALMGYDVYGTDISEKMVRFSRDNLNWALEKFEVTVERQLEIGDATKHVWRMPITAVAGEGFLGQPLGGQDPTPEKLAQIMHDCQEIMKGFLKNIASQVPSGTRLCIAAPAWFVKGTLHKLPVTENIEELGFAWLPFTHVDAQSLIYSREDQITHRHILPIVRV